MEGGDFNIQVSKREENNYLYRKKLKEKFKFNAELKKMQRHQHLPKYLYNAKQKSQVMKESKHRKIANQELNNPSQFVKPKPERVAKIVDSLE
jgi:WD repeat and SOF domain-containing protein 1